MLQVIFGRKGSGKTKRIIDMANGAIATTAGNIAFVDDDARYRADIKYQIRFIDASEYYIPGVDGLLGFLSGMVASNFDLALVFVDGFVRLAGKPIDELQDVIAKLDTFTAEHAIQMVLSISAPDGMEQPPEWLVPYII
nr:hypothetical protein [bacterium]